MANYALSSSPSLHTRTTQQQHWIHQVSKFELNSKLLCNHGCPQNSFSSKAHCTIVKAAKQSDQNNKKPKSVICTDCDGNGAIQCSQCKGSGVNPVDFFNGEFKAGDSCWLCGGKKDMLCGNCNGAGFIGGFMSTFDE